MKILKIERVPYGKDLTPINDREYKIVGTVGPVGTLSEWMAYAYAETCDKVEVTEKNGIMTTHEVLK